MKNKKPNYGKTEWSPFNGIMINEINAATCQTASKSSSLRKFAQDQIEILYCRGGELKILPEPEKHTLKPGDLAIWSIQDYEQSGANSRSKAQDNLRFIRIRINLSESPKCLTCPLADIRINLHQLFEHLALKPSPLIIRNHPAIRLIFEDLLNDDFAVNSALKKLKLLELLLRLEYTILPNRNHLNKLSPESASLVQEKQDDLPYFPRCQVDTVRAVHDYLIKNIGKRPTIETLSEQFKIPMTTLKSCFKALYGIPLGTFARTARIRKAAELLRETDLSVLHIACMVGYENPSKFTAAFRNTYKMAPRDFRKSVDRKDYFSSVSD